MQLKVMPLALPARRYWEQCASILALHYYLGQGLYITSILGNSKLQ